MSRKSCVNILLQLGLAVRARSGLSSSPLISGSFAGRILSIEASQIIPDPSDVLKAATRSFSTSQTSFTSNLLKVLKEEIKHEEEGYEKPEEIKSGPPAPFTLQESADGDTLLTLKRKFNGEDIAVDLHVNNQPSHDMGDGENANEDGETLNLVTFNVTVTKGSSSLVFECESDGTYVGIVHLSHEPKDGHSSESSYTGPVFAELDESLQNEMSQYLSDRGVTEELGEYLRHLIYDKEQREYMAWLKKVGDFVQ
ncbi:hypothetical protein CEUSTIGMA_g6750.t1 [Chlamydomonas eustigma]|uniref:Mitochondrial glycoprotein domain-containing protein n=1 Tax=Chlamydomonas eustigma TaxID=1157962 RepID=A0A250X8R6_9CHLO|nr:hypothetical protein CEUSTIGMA_g6750.t1 [Chlamydomonas eustigma]|eukprot:GAX79309.1 hypothetical protein CEUSTIGMA_g6750.t1 [Chlamydomonas eustigma]